MMIRKPLYYKGAFHIICIAADDVVFDRSGLKTLGFSSIKQDSFEGIWVAECRIPKHQDPLATFEKLLTLIQQAKLQYRILQTYITPRKKRKP